MGRDKRWLSAGGSDSWVVRAVGLLRERCVRGYVSIAAATEASDVGGWPCVPDAPPAGRGPLAGIHAGLVAADGLDLCVLACDYPLMTSALLQRICDPPLRVDLRLACDAGGRDHPLVARWSAGVRPAIERALAAGSYRVGALVGALSVERVAGGRGLTNVNDPAQLELLREER